MESERAGPSSSYLNNKSNWLGMTETLVFFTRKHLLKSISNRRKGFRANGFRANGFRGPGFSGLRVSEYWVFELTGFGLISFGLLGFGPEGFGPMGRYDMDNLLSENVEVFSLRKIFRKYNHAHKTREGIPLTSFLGI